MRGCTAYAHACRFDDVATIEQKGDFESKNIHTYNGVKGKIAWVADTLSHAPDAWALVKSKVKSVADHVSRFFG